MVHAETDNLSGIVDAGGLNQLPTRSRWNQGVEVFYFPTAIYKSVVGILKCGLAYYYSGVVDTEAPDSAEFPGESAEILHGASKVTDKGVGISIRCISEARDLAFVVDGIALAPGTAQSSQLGHRSVAPDKTKEVPIGIVRRPGNRTLVVDALGAVPPRVPVRRSQSSQVDHLAVAVQKRVIGVAGSHRGPDDLSEIVDGIGYRRAASQVANINQRSAIRHESSICTLRILRIPRHLAGGINSVADSRAASERPKIRHGAVAIQEDACEVRVRLAGCACDLMNNVDSAGHAVVHTRHCAQVGDRVGLRSAERRDKAEKQPTG